MPTHRSHKITILSLALVIFIDVVTIGLIFPLFAALFNDPHGILPMATSIKTRNLLYTLIISLPMFALLFGSPILGELSDRWGRRIVLLISLFGVFMSCLLSVVSFYVMSIVLLFISRILVALLDGSQAVAQAAIVDISFPEEKVKNMSLITLASTLGFIVGPIIGGVLADNSLCSWFGYKIPFFVAALLAFLNFILLKYTFTETRQTEEKEALRWHVVFSQLFKGFFDKRYAYLSLAFMAAQFTWAGIYQASNLLLVQKFHYSVTKLGFFSAYLGALVSIVLLFILRLLLKFINPLTIARSGLFIFMLGLLYFFLGRHIALTIWFALIPCSFGMALSYNALMALFSNAVTADEQGKVMGIMIGLMAIAWLLAGLFTGIFATISYQWTFLIQAIAAFLGFIFLLCYRENK